MGPSSVVGLHALTVLKKAVFAGEGTGDLISEGGLVRVRYRDGTGADDLAVCERFVKARERRTGLGAGEAETAIALGVSSVWGTGAAGVKSRVTSLQNLGRDTESAHNVAIGRTVGVHVTDILPIDVERQADTVPALDITLTVSDLIEDVAGSHRAQSVCLVVAYLEELG
jgi:hypothetical protein